MPQDVVWHIRSFCDTAGKVGIDRAFGLEPMRLEVVPHTVELLSSMMRRRAVVSKRAGRPVVLKHTIPIEGTSKCIEYAIYIRGGVHMLVRDDVQMCFYVWESDKWQAYTLLGRIEIVL